MVPVLYTLYPQLPPQSVIAISLGSICLITSLNSIQYARQGVFPEVKIVIILFLTCSLGALLGSGILSNLSPQVTRRIFAVVLVIITFRILTRKNSIASDAKAWQAPSFKMGGVGFAGSLLSSVTGLGGGIIFTPVFLGPLRMPVQLVAPYANLAMVFATAMGTIPHFFHLNIHTDYFSNEWVNQCFIGQVNLVVVGCLGLSSLLTSRLGVKLNQKVDGQKKRWLLASILFLLSAKILLTNPV